MFIANDWDIVNDVDDAEYIQFTGGADVSPMLYNEPKHPRTYNDPRRDDAESNLYWTYAGSKKMLGICRGGQFLNVMNGGRMYQDVNNHAIVGTHPATILDTGRIVQVTSTHHQMMMADYDGIELVTANLSTRKEDGRGVDIKGLHEKADNEVILYNNRTISLCFQPHPEYVEPKHECQRLYFDLIKQYLEE
jgi:gamma-glutamyl-gamma-aminobutyrate hydrolase PuuD